MIKLRKLDLEDLEKYEYWKQPFHSYHLFNGPYYRKHSKKEIELQISSLRKTLLINSDDRMKLISNDSDDLIGEVSWHWKSEETLWLEVGIVIFDENFWNKGIGYNALQLWIDQLFLEKKEIVRLGLTTWSGNHGMIKLSQKLGMKKEAEYRNARIINGVYFDSVSFGVLREEWEVLRGSDLID